MNVMGLLLLVISTALLLSRNLRITVGILALQGALLAVVVASSGPLTGTTAAFAAATVLVKVLLIPGLLYRLMHRWSADVRQDHPLPVWAYAAGMTVMLLGAHVSRVLTPAHVIQHPLLFFYALAAINLGFVMIVARRHLLSQVVALVAIENGLVVLEVSLASSLPMFLEIGILLDLAIAVTILVWLTRRIHQEIQTTDVVALRRLRG